MRITCPTCASQYEVDAGLFGPEGREVQCAQCDTQWTQYPEAPAPVEAAGPTPVPPVAAPTPSERLPQEERRAIRRAVEQEIAIRDAGAVERADLESQPSGEDDLIRSLREQLRQVPEEPDDDIPDVRRPTGRRSLARAADMAGVRVEDEEEEAAPARGRPRTARERSKSAGSRDLAQALEEYERERRPRGGGRSGFVLALVLGALAAGAYVARPQIAAQFPEAAPALASYADGVDAARRTTERLYAEARVLVTTTVAELQGSGEGATATE